MEEEIIIPEEETFDYKKFRYILDDDGYIFHGSFGGYIKCNFGECTEYNGDVPDYYSSLEDWYDGEIEKLNAWKIVENNLVFDENKYNELQAKYQIEAEENETATHGWVRKQGNKTESIVIDELSNEIEGSSLIVLNDSGNYPINKIDIECEDAEVLGDNLVENGEIIEMPLGTSRINIANIYEAGTYRYSCDSSIVSEGEENEYLLFLMDVDGNDIGEIYVEHSKDFKSCDFTITEEQITTYKRIIVRLYSSYSNETALENDVTYTNVKVQKKSIGSVDNVKVISSNKNLLGITNVSETINGINIIVNADGSIKLNGTATSDIEFDLIGDSLNQDMLFLLKSNTNYFVSGLDEEVIELYSFDGTDKTLIGSYENELINLSNDYIVTQAALKIFNGSSYENVVIYPQIEINEVATDFIKHEETSNKVNLYNNKASITTLYSYQPQTIIMIDKIANLNIEYFKYKYLDEKFTSIETKSDEIQMIVSQNTETIEQLTNQTNKLIANTNGLQNILDNRGGNNLIRNSYFYEYENGLLTYWSGVQNVVEKYESKSRNALSLQNGKIKQHISLTNKKYCCSFKYIKLTEVANAKFIINSKEHDLNGDVGYENYFEVVEDLKSDSITIEFECDTNDGFLIYEPMLNEGESASLFTQNASESISDTVNIGKGIEVLASNISNKTRIDADGLRGINTDNDEIVFYQTTDGIYGKELETESIRSGNLIITTRNGHNFLSGL